MTPTEVTARYLLSVFIVNIFSKVLEQFLGV